MNAPQVEGGVLTQAELSALSASQLNTNITTVGAGTLTAAAMGGGIITRSGPTSAFTDTTDTATALIAQIPGTPGVNYAWPLLILNTTIYQETIAAGTGVTLGGPSATVLAGNCLGIFSVVYTGVGAVTLTLMAVVDRGIDNFAATTDPGTSNDNTQGYGIGSLWINTTLNREWTCISAATGAAIWSFGGAAYASGGYNPASEVTAGGGSTALMAAEGNINRQISSAGINPGATGADNVLAAYTLPASFFDQANRALTITADGSFAANGNSKRLKLIFNPASATVGSTVGAGGTTIADTGTVTTSGGGWSLQGTVMKYGAAASNTQIGIHNQAQIGAAVAALLAPSLITATESGAILIAVTGNATTATTDIVFNWLEVNAMN